MGDRVSLPPDLVETAVTFSASSVSLRSKCFLTGPLTELVCNGQASVLTKGTSCDFDAGRRLAAFVFRAVDQRHNLANYCLIEAGGHQLGDIPVIFDVALQDRIQN